MKGKDKAGRVPCTGPDADPELTCGWVWEGEGPFGLESPTAAQEGKGGRGDWAKGSTRALFVCTQPHARTLGVLPAYCHSVDLRGY